MENINVYFSLATLLTPAVIIAVLRRCVTPISTKRFSNDILNLVLYSVLNICIYVLTRYIFNCCCIRLAPIGSVLNIYLFDKILGSYVVFVFILPFLLGVLVGYADKHKWLRNILDKIFNSYTETNILTQWEEVFSMAPTGDVTIKLKDGNEIRGNYADGSGASTDANNKDIFIDQISYISGKKCNPKATSMWISGNEIVYVVFNNIKYHNTSDKKE